MATKVLRYILFIIVIGLAAFYHVSAEAYCGNGIVDGNEECDNGGRNSDSTRDACRSSCNKAGCGDGVADSGEECDGNDRRASICSDFKVQGSQQVLSNNTNYWSGYGRLSCNYDCTLDKSECGYCGDGITQTPHEQCDDRNSSNDDGCNNNCSSCVQLTSNIDITTDTEICSHPFNITDYGDEGVIILKHPDITLDCDGATLTGQGVGVGIYVKMSNNVTIRNCNVTGYAVGVKIVNSQNVHFSGEGNRIYGNDKKLVLENSKLALRKMGGKTSESLVGKTRFTQKNLPGKPAMTPQTKTSSGKVTATAGSKKPGAAKKPLGAAPPKLSGTKREPAGTGSSAPVITSPRPNRVFRAPAEFTATATYNRSHEITYGIKKSGQRRPLATSKNGKFTHVEPGDYCVYARYRQKGGAVSKCVAFKVVAAKRLKRPARIHR